MSNRHLLVVDDEPVNLEVISEYLDGSGYRLSLVESARAAWDLLSAPDCDFSVALLDRMMPETDGIALMRRMKAHPRLKDIPVIIQTAATAPEQVAEGIAAGAFYYLTKPYACDALLGVVKTALESVEMVEELACRMQRDKASAQLIHRAELYCTTLEDVQTCASMISAMCPDPSTAVIGIMELLVNAVEHGNLGITYEEKKALKLCDGWEQEVERRSRLPEHRGKRVRVELERMPGLIELKITDQGNGFDWHKYLELDHARAFDPNGRGIAMARMLSFATIQYHGRGNEVYATLRV